MKMITLTPPPDNEQLKDGPLKILAITAAACMIVMGTVLKLTAKSDLWDQAITPATRSGVVAFLISAGVAVFAAVLIFRPFRSRIGYDNIVALLPGSLWRMVADKADLISSLGEESAAFDAELAALQRQESPDQAAVNRLAERYAALVNRVDPFFVELIGAMLADCGRAEFLRQRIWRAPYRPEDEAEVRRQSAEMRSGILAACGRFKLNPRLLARHIAHLA